MMLIDVVCVFLGGSKDHKVQVENNESMELNIAERMLVTAGRLRASSWVASEPEDKGEGW